MQLSNYAEHETKGQDVAIIIYLGILYKYLNFETKAIMGEIETSDKQINFYYNSNSSRAKKALAFAKAQGLSILEIDLLKTKLPGTQIIELAERLKLHVSDLVNQEHPDYISKFKTHDLSDTDWIKMIQNHPEIMKQPIALHGDHTVLVETPTDILKI